MSPRAGLLFGLLAAAPLACDARLPAPGSERAGHDDASPVATSPAQPDDNAPATTSAPTASPPAPSPAEPLAADAPEPTATSPNAPLIGRWQGRAVCLELYPTGEFELSLLGKGPKIVLTGTARQQPADEGGAVELVMRTTRIVRHRWVGPCRKTVVRAAELDEQDVLGVIFKKAASPAAAVSLRATPRGDALELCGERCGTLARAEPRLAGRWRDPRALHNAEPAGGWRVGDVVDLKLAPGYSSSLWIGLSETAHFTAYGELEARHLGDGRFALVFTPSMLSDVPEDMDKATLELLGGPLAQGETRRLTARRQAGWKIELCGAPGRCVTLPSFDAIL